jgi:N-acetylglucosamine kinase-like BadF-type ATPase
MSSLLLGVDGGNTKTVAVVVTEDGAILGSGRGGCGDIHNASGPEAAIEEIVGAAAVALGAAGVAAADLAAAAFSLAGADWPEDFTHLRGELRRRLSLVDDPEIVNDAVGGLRSGTDDMVGVAVVIGTYSAIAGRNADGDLFHLGFWPDSTGAHALGSQALSAIWRHMLGLGPETSLLDRALARWEAADPEELLHVLTRIDGPPEEPEAARFAAAGHDEAEAGDRVARTIVQTVAGRMGDYARVCAERTGQLGAPFPLVLCGSVLRHPSPLLRSVLVSRVPDARPVYPDVEPVAGAVLLAADRVGARPGLTQLRVAPVASPEPRG